MIDGVNGVYSYNGNTYVQRNRIDAQTGFLLASAAAAGLKALLPSFSNPFVKQIVKEHAQNDLYADVFQKSVEQSGLVSKGLKVTHLERMPYEVGAPSKISNYDVKVGLNAFFSPKSKEIVLNTKKASITGFHELGHAMNNMSGKVGKILQSLRKPGYALAGLMGTVAILSRPKPKEAPRNAFDWIQDNCHWIAIAGMLPTVAEEALASYNGIKIAKKAGLAENLVKNLRKFYGKALLSYAGYAAITGLSVFAMSKITEMFTRPRKVD